MIYARSLARPDLDVAARQIRTIDFEVRRTGEVVMHPVLLPGLRILEPRSLDQQVKLVEREVLAARLVRVAENQPEVPIFLPWRVFDVECAPSQNGALRAIALDDPQGRRKLDRLEGQRLSVRSEERTVIRELQL